LLSILTQVSSPEKVVPSSCAQVLTLLVRRAGDVVTREEIQKEVWGDETFVDFELSINSCIRGIISTVSRVY
jgi:DNA-binding winged helix-turn-helix (wHTH) protein